MTEVRTICLTVFLAVCAVLDFCFRKLPFSLLLTGVFLGTVLEVLECGMGPALFGNLMPGILLLLICLALPEQIGRGDGWMLMAVGALGGWAKGVLVLEGGLLFLFPVAFFWAVIRKRRRQELPFAPFMMAAWLCSLTMF
ncbi:MAG: hypothetical protein HFI67_00815 [Lachnospiraceae bacterium]|nr:hypothetical protein [Lachnospiraceae bacterium]